jgi:hypothetical protein
MPTNLRRQGVYGDNLPAKSTLTVTASEFNIAGLIGTTKRQYDKAYKVTSIEEYNLIFGSQENAANYLPDCVKAFFDNTAGVEASLYIVSTPGYDTGSSSIDAVVASSDKADAGADIDAYLIQSAYKNELQYGLAGNRTGYQFTQINRFSTKSAVAVASTGVSEATLDSVIDIKVGDLVRFVTNGGAALVYKKITEVDQGNKIIKWSGDFESTGGAGETLAIDDPVEIPGFQIRTFLKSVDGIIKEVETEKAKFIMSSEPEVADYYVNTIMEDHNYLKVTEQSASTLADRLPPDDVSIVYLANGDNGTAVASETALNKYLNNFDTLPVRIIHYPESSSETLQKSVITYSLSRPGDNPKVIVHLAENRSKTQMITAGNNYQTSDFQPAIIINNWIGINDPFTTSETAPDRNIPPGGHVMGAWIRSISQLGIHYIPATQDITLRNVNNIVGDQLLDDDDRTDVAKAGVNVIQFITGIGSKIASFFTASTNVAYLYGNIIIMRDFVKVSVVDSLKPAENKPNVFKRIEGNRSSIYNFMLNLWFKGSTGNVPAGETFGQTFDVSGNPTDPADHIQVIADPENNPQSEINVGNQNYDVYFSGPTPAGSIRVGVGILVK